MMHGLFFLFSKRKAGRILTNGCGTGVEVAHVMVHGGPHPATSAGSLAIDRVLRPLCYQDVPDALLPPALQDANPLRITGLVNDRIQSREDDDANPARWATAALQIKSKTSLRKRKYHLATGGNMLLGLARSGLRQVGQSSYPAFGLIEFSRHL